MILLVQGYDSRALNVTQHNEIGIYSVAYMPGECGNVSSLQPSQGVISYL
jgi:hypothetical protein